MDDTNAEEKLQAILDKVSPEVSATFMRNRILSEALPNKKERVTVADIEHIMAGVMLSFKGLTADQQAAIRTTLEGMAGTHSRAEIQQVVENVARRYVTENEQQSPKQTQQQHIQTLWTDYEQRERKNEDAFSKFYLQGKITEEQLDYLHKERARLDALPKDAAERLRGEQHLVAYEQALAERIRDEAVANGDHDTEQSAKNIVRNTAEQKRELEEIHNINNGINSRQQMAAEITTAKPNLYLKDDEESAIYNTPSLPPTKMVVADVTYDDIQSQASIKERIAGKGLAKI